MKICLKCNKEFKTIVKINGKSHVLGNRKFCLECSPFKLHNTKNLLNGQLKTKNHKECAKCKLFLPNTSEFFYNRTKRGDLSSYCKKCNTIVKVEQGRKVKLEAVNYLGGKCVICNYSKHPSVLDFHHKDPSKKELKISDQRNSSFKKIKSELDKCVLVCANCHREIHIGLHSKYLIVKDQLS